MCLRSYIWDSIEHSNPQPASSREGSRALGAGAAGTNLSANRSVSINPAPNVWPNRNKQTSERITVFIHREFIGQNFELQVTGSQVSLSKMNFWKDRFLFDKTMDEIRCKWNQRLKCQHRLGLWKSWFEGQRQSTKCLNKGAESEMSQAARVRRPVRQRGGCGWK